LSCLNVDTTATNKSPLVKKQDRSGEQAQYQQVDDGRKHVSTSAINNCSKGNGRDQSERQEHNQDPKDVFDYGTNRE